MTSPPQEMVERAREWMTHSFPGAKLFDNRVQSLAHLLTSERERALEEAAAAVPSNWCDALLTGKPGTPIPATCPDIERLLHGVSARIRSLKSPTVEG